MSNPRTEAILIISIFLIAIFGLSYYTVKSNEPYRDLRSAIGDNITENTTKSQFYQSVINGCANLSKISSTSEYDCKTMLFEYYKIELSVMEK